MLMPILEERRSDAGDAVIKTISSRVAGGRKELNTEPSRVCLLFLRDRILLKGCIPRWLWTYGNSGLLCPPCYTHQIY